SSGAWGISLACAPASTRRPGGPSWIWGQIKRPAIIPGCRIIPSIFSGATRAPVDYFPVQTTQGLRYIAHGKDPYFPSWCDTAQLNYSNLELHDAMQDQLLRLAQWCDGVRCDMAMLCLSDIFSRTWGGLDLPVPPREFWHEALQAERTRFPD